MLIAAAAITLFTWACGGFVGAALVSTALGMTFTALVLLSAWILLCRDCEAIFVLIDWFTRLTLGMPLLAAVLATLGLFACAAGAIVVGGLFGVVLAALELGRGIVRCTR
jgi:hypothetical protein